MATHSSNLAWKIPWTEEPGGLPSMGSHRVGQCTVDRGLLCPWDFAGKNTGVGCHFLLQRIFLTQGLNLCLLHCRQILYQLSYQRSPDSIMQKAFPLGHKSVPSEQGGEHANKKSSSLIFKE